MSDPAQELAKEIATGTYHPSTLENCNAVLPVDRSPQVIRLTQFTLFADPKADLQSPDPPKYLILQQYQTGPNHRGPKWVLDLIGSLAAAVTSGGAAAGAATRPPSRTTASPRAARSARPSTRAESASPPLPPAGLADIRKSAAPRLWLVPDKRLERDDFVAALNTRFRVQAEPGAPVDLTLVQVSDLVSAARQELFSLVFHGPPDTLLPQRMYHMENERLGVIQLFIVPIGQNADGYAYEAVFNRLKK